MSKFDRLSALLESKNSNNSKLSHSSERSALNNEDRKYNRIVYDNEMKQANLYNQSAMPPTSKDIGISFKINQYVIRLTQALGTKIELNKVLTAQFSAGVPLAKLRGTTREAQVIGEFFRKSDVIGAFNELMAYINTFGNEIKTDDSFRSQIYNTSFNPLIQLLLSSAALYPAFFFTVPPPTNHGTVNEKADERKVYETVREQSIGCYSLYNVMANNLNNLIFKAITREDIETYIIKDNVKLVFQSFPFVPQAQPQPQQGQPQPGQAAPIIPAQPAPAVLPAINPADPNLINQFITEYENARQRYLFKSESSEAYNHSKAAIQANFSPISAADKSAIKANIKARIETILQQLGQVPNLKNTGANQGTLTALYQQNIQQPAPQPAPPAPQPAQPAVGNLTPAGQALRAHNQGQPITETGNVYTETGIDNTQGMGGADKQDLRAVVRDTIDVVKQLENQRNGILRQNSDADIDEVIANETQLATATLTRLIPLDADKRAFVSNVIRSMKVVRRDYAAQEAIDNQTPDWDGEQNALYGLGKYKGHGVFDDHILPFLTKHFLGSVGSLFGFGKIDTNTMLSHIYDYENSARRQVGIEDIDNLLRLKPALQANPDKTAELVSRLSTMRVNEPHSYGRGPAEIQQGLKKRASDMPSIMEFDPKAEALKRYGAIMSGGCNTCALRGGMDNTEMDWTGYGETDNEDNTPFKRMIIGMPNPFAPKNPPVSQPAPFLPYNDSFDDQEDLNHFKDIFLGEGAHYEEIERPIDLDAHADAIRRNNENYKVNTGKMKSVKYTNVF